MRERFPGQAKEVDLAAFADGHIKGYAVTPETATDIASASRILTETMEKLITFGDGSINLVRDAAREIDASQKLAGKG